MSMKNKLESRITKLEFRVSEQDKKIARQEEEIRLLRQELDGVRKGDYMLFKWLRSKMVSNATLIIFMQYLKNHRYQKDKKWNKSKDMSGYLQEDKDEHSKDRKRYVLESGGKTYYLLMVVYVEKLLGFSKVQQCRFLRTLSNMGYIEVKHRKGRRYIYTDVVKMASSLEKGLELVA